MSTSEQVTILMAIAERETLFRDQLGDPFIRVNLGNRSEIWTLRSEKLTNYLMRKFYLENQQTVPSTTAVKQAVKMLMALAEETERRDLRLRVAPGENGTIWYDLGDETWRAVKLTAAGWEINATPPILFKRYATNCGLVLPERKENPLARLFDFVNIHDEGEKLLFKIYLITNFIPGIPHPAAAFYGHQGAAKTTAARVIKRLVDPGLELTAFPESTKELAQFLAHNYVCVFDNLARISSAQSNILCQAVTGGGLMKRRLYTDEGDVALAFKGCVVMNGINLVAGKPDLLDRSLLFELGRIDETARKDEKTFWQDFETERPFILGGIFDVLASALQRYPAVQIAQAPRMADFFKWGIATCEAMGIDREVFIEAYEANRRKMHGEVLTGEPLAEAIIEFLRERARWEGKASELLDALVAANARGIPKLPNLLSRRLKEIALNLKAAYIEVEFGKNTADNTTIIRIQKDIPGATEAA